MKGITSTEAVHAGEPEDEPYDAVTTPIVQTSTYTFASTEELVRYTSGEHERMEYGRYGNPTCRAVERAMATLEGTEDSALLASGMAAMATTILALTKHGSHVVFFRDAYRMTRELVTTILGRFGVHHTLVPSGDLAALGDAIRPDTRLVVSESPTNPHLSCVDLEALAAIVKPHRTIKTVIDATFASPVNCRPAQLGIDLVVQSATKYVAGHNDVLAGTVSGPAGLVSIVKELRGVLGPVCDPHAAYLVLRGMKTLKIRVEKQNATALAVARHLERHPAIERVFYPGLASHPDHAVAARQMSGFGGVVTFVCRGGLDGARKVVDALELPRIGPSFGGVESLVEPPVLMSYYELSPEERARIGIQEGLVRLSVGIEDEADVIADLDRALSTSHPAGGVTYP
jgi:cystathionine gamma-synthase